MELGIARILDANFNRAREALRVIEDFARFRLDDAGIAADAKQLRHHLAEPFQALTDGRGWAGRDTPGDVGTTLSTPGETVRPSMAAVVRAAAKRLSEALRAVEEYGKIVDPVRSAEIEQMRYAGYDLEKRVLAVIDARARWGAARLYVLITATLCRQPWQEVIRAAAAAGADAFQLREKELSGRQLIERAAEFTGLCRELRVRSIINDRVDVARAVDADGVHVGQDDLPVAAARRVLGTAGGIGVSTHTLPEALSAAAALPDYLAVGPMFATALKPDYRVAGPALLATVAARVSLPLVAIGGIDADNVGQLAIDERTSVAVCTAVLAADDVYAATRRLRSQLPD